MRGWHKVSLVITGLALIIIAGAYFMGLYAPTGFSSSVAQSLSIAVLALGITSSTIAVLSGRGIEEYFKRRDEAKRVKSALVSYLAGLPLQILAISSIFYGISGGKSFPSLSIRSELDYIVQPNSIDTSYYEKNIKDHLLYLPEHLATQAINVTMLVALINYNYSSLVKDVSKDSIILKIAKPTEDVLSAYLESHGKAHNLMFEYGKECIKAIEGLKRAILEGREGTIDLQPLIDKLSSVREAYQTGRPDFYRKLFS